MPYAILTPDGQIKATMLKPSPFTKIEEGERIVGYNLPPFDPETQSMVIELPVPADAQEVAYTLSDRPDEVLLPILRARQWEAIKVSRSAAEFGGFVWDGKTFDSDPTSIQRLGLAIQYATTAMSTGQPFMIDWTLADNTAVTLSAVDMVNVGFAMAAHINAQHTKARGLRAEIEAAQTKQGIAAVSW